jgi:hypothetical protein
VIYIYIYTYIKKAERERGKKKENEKSFLTPQKSSSLRNQDKQVRDRKKERLK